MSVFDFLSRVDAFFWGYIGFSMIAVLGGYFTIQTRFFQIRSFPAILKTFAGFIRFRSDSSRGTHPLKVFFTSVGGMVGVGSIVGIVTALQLGGPGAIFWVWIAAFLGSLIKYAEVFLGLKYRVPNEKGGYDGGSIHFLRTAFNVRWIGALVCFLLCLYGAEIYQFSVLTHSISANWHLDHMLVTISILSLILFAVLGGIQRVGKICSLLMPAFTLIYIGMCCWVIGHHISELPGLFVSIFKTAFTGHAALGGFVGSSVFLSLQNGVARSVYSADIGIGYDSIIHSETSAADITSQARLTLLGVFVDNIVCTCSLLVALCTGLWCVAPPMDSTLVVQKALSLHFPGQEMFMPIFLFVLVYTTLISYLLVGVKCAHQLHSNYGEKVYLFLAVTALFSFSFLDQSRALLVMSLSGCMLLIINLLGIFLMRREIEFSLLDSNREKSTYADACGNTFLIFDYLNDSFSDQEWGAIKERIWTILSKAQVDDALVLRKVEEEDRTIKLKMHVLEPDRTEADFCGNGARAVGFYLYHKYGTGPHQFVLVSRLGEHELKYENSGSLVNMGTPLFSPEKLTLDFHGSSYTFSLIDCVERHLVTDDFFDIELLSRVGEHINSSWRDRFPQGINVNCFRCLDSYRLEVLTYERGVYVITKACGTGSLACTKAAIDQKLISSDSTVTIQVLGGELKIDQSKDVFWLGGPVNLS